MNAEELLVPLIGVFTFLLGVLVTSWARLVLKARKPIKGCDFPGCLAARIELRRLADEYDKVPSQMLIDLINGVEDHEHRKH